eukprot:4979363-Pleurochrysis_carterae.AAC.1
MITPQNGSLAGLYAIYADGGICGIFPGDPIVCIRSVAMFVRGAGCQDNGDQFIWGSAPYLKQYWKQLSLQLGVELVHWRLSTIVQLKH